MKNNLDTQAVINDYKNGMGAEKLAANDALRYLNKDHIASTV